MTNSFLSDKALLDVKLWRASNYSDQDDYLQSIGSQDKFLDYMGRGEIGISVRNFLWGGSLKGAMGAMGSDFGIDILFASILAFIVSRCVKKSAVSPTSVLT